MYSVTNHYQRSGSGGAGSSTPHRPFTPATTVISPPPPHPSKKNYNISGGGGGGQQQQQSRPVSRRGQPVPASRPSTAPAARPSTAPSPRTRPLTPGGAQAHAPSITRPTSSSTSKQKQVRRSSTSATSSRNNRTLSVVLPPRVLANLSSTSMIDTRQQQSQQSSQSQRTFKINKLHFAPSYTPHKSHWIRNALENLGIVWVRDGKITMEQLISEEFEEKMGVLYDLAMVRKHEAIDRLVSEVVGEEDEELVAVQRNFPFAPHLSDSVKASMSDALLRIMMRGGGAEGPKKKSEDTDGKGDCDAGGGAAAATAADDNASNSFENSLKKRKSLTQCYVVDGGRLVVGGKKFLMKVGGSVVNRFGESGQSRVRKYPQTSSNQELDFYRRTANMMGFFPHEVKIRYCKDSRQLIVSGARPARDAENARQVREVLEVPKGVDVRRLIVLRTGKGSLIFEEMEEGWEEDDPDHYCTHEKEEKKKKGNKTRRD